jgi:hypothetical protein
VATTWTLLTPSGTTKVSSEPVGLKVHVVVPEVVEQLPAAWTGVALWASKSAPKSVPSTTINFLT